MEEMKVLNMELAAIRNLQIIRNIKAETHPTKGFPYKS
jgi:hypothetical protein